MNVRQIGCGRLGATVWPSSIALAALLSHPRDDDVDDDDDPSEPTRGPSSMVWGRRVLELGSGCGLPSATASILGAERVLATDHWEEGADGDGDGDGTTRLMPRNPHGANLAHNVVPAGGAVRRLDCHDADGARAIADDYRPDLIVGSDLVYYPSDVTPLLRTLGILLGGGGDRDDDGRGRRPRRRGRRTTEEGGAAFIAPTTERRAGIAGGIPREAGGGEG